MDVKGGAYRVVLVAAAAAFLAAGCASVGPAYFERVEFIRSFEGKFPPHPPTTPVEALTLTDAQMDQQNYVRIGLPTVRFEDQHNPLVILLSEAGSYGADAVRVETANLKETAYARESRCVNSYKDVYGKYQCMSVSSRDVPVTIYASHASLWRRDPVLHAELEHFRRLQRSMAAGDFKAAREALVGDGVRIARRFSKIEPVLLAAVRSRDARMVALSFDSGASPPSEAGSALQWRDVESGEMVKELLKRISPRERQRLANEKLKYVDNPEPAMVRVLLDAEADPNAVRCANITAQTDCVPLLAYFAAAGNPGVASALLDGGADPNAVIRPKAKGPAPSPAYCCTALDIARHHKQTAVEAVLRQRGAKSSAELRALADQKVSQIAARGGPPSLVAFLHSREDAGEAPLPHYKQDPVKYADVAQGSSGPASRDLIVAAGEGEVERIRSALKRNADVNARVQGSNVTALMNAAENGCLECARILIDAGANLDHAASTGTALIYAAGSGYEDLVKLLLERGARVNIKAELFGSTALHSAAAGGHSAVARALLDKGADPALANSSGETPLAVAVRQKRREVALLLAERTSK